VKKIILTVLALALAGPAAAQPRVVAGSSKDILTTGVTNSTSFTATEFSSAPAVYVSTIIGIGKISENALDIRDEEGNSLLRFDGGTGSGLSINIKKFGVGSRRYDLDVYGESDNGTPGIGLRKKDTSVLAGDVLGAIYWYDGDTSTNGKTEKAYHKLQAGADDWGSSTAMESAHHFGTSRYGGTIVDRMIVTSSMTKVHQLLIAGKDVDLTPATTIVCSTCALQVIGGTSISGALDVIGAATITGGAGIGAALESNKALVVKSLSATGSVAVVEIKNSGGTTLAAFLQDGSFGLNVSNPSEKLHINAGTIRFTAGGTAPTAGGALCLNASGDMKKCTSAVDASGNCTCP